MNPTAADLLGWFPGKILWEAGEPWVVWRPSSAGQAHEADFDDTLHGQAGGAEDEGQSFHTPIALLREVAELPAAEPGPMPAGFIFHWTRSAATLVAQTLAASHDHLVLTQSQPVDALLRGQLWDARATPEWRQQQLHWLVLATARSAPQRTRLYVEFDAWQVLQLPVVRAAFPAVPWLFIYRDPLEVLASHEHRCGTQFVPGELEPELFGWTQSEIMRRPFQVHWARLLEAFGQAALHGLKAGGGRLVNHAELSATLTDGILRAFGVPRTPAVLALMEDTIRYHSRDPKTVAPAPAAAQLQQDFPEHAQAVAQYVAGTYAKLEAARTAGFGLPPAAER